MTSTLLASPYAVDEYRSITILVSVWVPTSVAGIVLGASLWNKVRLTHKIDLADALTGLSLVSYLITSVEQQSNSAGDHRF